MIVATTPRLTLRRWSTDDAASLDGIYGDAETMRLFGNGSTFTRAEVAASLTAIEHAYATRGYGNYAVIERETGTIIGHCGTNFAVKRERVEADWAIGKAWWNRGYATEAATAVFLRAFTADGIERIYGISHRDNAPSIAVMRRLGMRYLEDLDANGAPSVLYRVTRDEFKPPAGIRTPITIG